MSVANASQHLQCFVPLAGPNPVGFRLNERFCPDALRGIQGEAPMASSVSPQSRRPQAEASGAVNGSDRTTHCLLGSLSPHPARWSAEGGERIYLLVLP